MKAGAAAPIFTRLFDRTRTQTSRLPAVQEMKWRPVRTFVESREPQAAEGLQAAPSLLAAGAAGIGGDAPGAGCCDACWRRTS